MPRDMSKTTKQDKPRTEGLHLREPISEDGAQIWELIRDCKPLDENSMYCNLLQCDHFSETSVVAELDGEIVGWISGYIVPKEEALFVWQVAVSSKARGLGLGGKMLDHLIERDACEDVHALKTTITEDNDASWGLFKSFARRQGGELTDEAHFTEEDHFGGRHDTEHMVTIKLPEEEDMAKAA